MNISRRNFVAGAIAMGVTASGLTTSEAAEKPPGWIDAHVHVWTPNTKNYPISSNFEKSAMSPPSFTDKELFEHCKPAGVDRIVLIQMSFYEYDHSYMIKAMEENPGVFSGVGLIDYRADNLVERMKELQANGMRGFRLHSKGDTDTWGNDPGMTTLWKTASELGLAVCPLINPQDIVHVDALCKKFPDTTVVVDHFARIGVSGTIEKGPLEKLCRLSRFPNTYVKTSAFYALGQKAAPHDDLIPMIRKVYDSFGPERLMWASDCPFQVQGKHTYEASIALIRDRIDWLSTSDKEWMLRGTAEKVYF